MSELLFQVLLAVVKSVIIIGFLLTGFAYMTPSYDVPAPYTDMFGHYDLVSRVYSLTGFIAETGGLRQTKAQPDREWTPDSLAGSGIR